MKKPLKPTTAAIIAGNKLIAESLGYNYYPHNDVKNMAGWKLNDRPLNPKLHRIGPVGQIVYLCRNHHELRFFNSWDWLIPACQNFNIKRQKLKSIKRGVIHSLYANNIRRAISRYDMPAAWEELVAALQWLKSMENGSKKR